MMFVSKVPSLIGAKQSRENRMITQTELAEKTGLRRQTVQKWTKAGSALGNLDPDTVDAWLRYFDVTLNDLVDVMEKASQEPDS